MTTHLPGHTLQSAYYPNTRKDHLLEMHAMDVLCTHIKVCMPLHELQMHREEHKTLPTQRDI